MKSSSPEEDARGSRRPSVRTTTKSWSRLARLAIPTAIDLYSNLVDAGRSAHHRPRRGSADGRAARPADRCARGDARHGRGGARWLLSRQQSTDDSTPTPIFSAEGQSVVRKTRVVKTAAAAVVAGFPIAIGVVLLLDAFQKRRANRPARPDHDDELAGAADDEYELELGTVRPGPGLARADRRLGRPGRSARCRVRGHGGRLRTSTTSTTTTSRTRSTPTRSTRTTTRRGRGRRGRRRRHRGGPRGRRDVELTMTSRTSSTTSSTMSIDD